MKAIREWGRKNKTEANLLCAFLMVAWIVSIPFIFMLYDKLK